MKNVKNAKRSRVQDYRRETGYRYWFGCWTKPSAQASNQVAWITPARSQSVPLARQKSSMRSCALRLASDCGVTRAAGFDRAGTARTICDPKADSRLLFGPLLRRLFVLALVEHGATTPRQFSRQVRIVLLDHRPGHRVDHVYLLSPADELGNCFAPSFETTAFLAIAIDPIP